MKGERLTDRRLEAEKLGSYKDRSWEDKKMRRTDEGQGKRDEKTKGNSLEVGDRRLEVGGGEIEGEKIRR